MENIDGLRYKKKNGLTKAVNMMYRDGNRKRGVI